MIWILLATQVATLIVALYAARKAMWASQFASEARERADLSSISTTQQIETLDGLYRRLGLERGALPPTRGWAASPDVLTVLYDQAKTSNARSIVECGSGTSTIVLARYCQQMGAGRVVTIDHDAKFAEITRQRLIELGLEGYVTIQVAPLVQQTIGNEQRVWYDLGKVELPEEIDLAFIDGPPVVIIGEDARAPAGTLIAPRLSKDGRIVFDDASRSGERKMTEGLVKTFPNLEKEQAVAEKGCHIVINRA